TVSPARAFGRYRYHFRFARPMLTETFELKGARNVTQRRIRFEDGSTTEGVGSRAEQAKGPRAEGGGAGKDRGPEATGVIRSEVSGGAAEAGRDEEGRRGPLGGFEGGRGKRLE